MGAIPGLVRIKTSSKSRCEGDVWCGAEGEGKASKDSRESFCSCCTQKSDLDEHIVIFLASTRGPMYCGNPTAWAWKRHVLFCPWRMRYCRTSVPWAVYP